MATAQLTELLARWDSGDGKPYKGRLIDWSAYQSDPTDLGCMCAQGQALYVIGGWAPEKIRDTVQADADRETAKLLNISRGHACLLRGVNDSIDGAPSIVLTDPEKVIGDQAEKILDFWHYMDSMTAEQWAAARAAASAAARAAARAAASAAARAAARAAASAAARAAASAAASAAARAAGEYATSEIMGAHILRENGTPFTFLPMFGFASPEEIPARPETYGQI